MAIRLGYEVQPGCGHLHQANNNAPVPFWEKYKEMLKVKINKLIA